MNTIVSNGFRGDAVAGSAAPVDAAAAMRAAEWLLTSGVQVADGDPQANGGFVSWYDQETQSMPYVYAEITGYLATAMCWLYERTADPRFLDSAVRAADWLLDTGIYHAPTGGMRCLQPLAPSRFDYKHNQIYTFDCGVILNGLVNVYRATGSAKYLNASTRLGDWLCTAAQRANGSFRPVYDIANDAWVESDNEWSLCAGSYHTKISLGLANLFSVSGAAHYARAAERGCDFALTFQQPDGRFVSFPANGGTNSHPHTYSAEGLWVTGSLLGREAYLDASARATAWLFTVQSPEGLVPRHYHNDEPLYNERVDILAQALRMAEIHTANGRLSSAARDGIERLVPIILRNQASDADARVDGGFYFGRLSNGDQMRHVNVWVSAFAAQALLLRADAMAGQPMMKPQFMI